MERIFQPSADGFAEVAGIIDDADVFCTQDLKEAVFTHEPLSGRATKPNDWLDE
jgi:hypothetical protein